MIKCPYCTEERPSRSRLQTHVNQIHYLADTQPNRMAAIDEAVVSAEAAALPANQCTSSVAAGFGQTHRCPQVFGHSGDHGDLDSSPRWKDEHAAMVDDERPRCTCGSYVVLTTDDNGTRLAHSFGGRNGCTDARLSSSEPTPEQRESLNEAWDRVGVGLDKAGQEMAELRASLDAVDERMRRMDAELTKPSVVRRATLNQVWDKLLDAGHLAAAREVMKMIERVVD